MNNALLLTLLLAGKPYSVEDQVALKRLGDFDVSPDGALVVFALRSTDLEANRGRTDLWLMKRDGSALRPLTQHPENDSDPQFSPDGRSVFFLSSRSGLSQVTKLSLEGGEPVAVTQSPLDVQAFQLSRRGQWLAFSADVFLNCDLECTEKRLAEKSKQKATGQLYQTLFIRHWDTWGDGRRSHLFVQPIDGGKPVDVMPGLDADCIGKPFGSNRDFTFSPDDQSLVFSANRAGREEAWSTNFDIFQASLDGKTEPKNLTEKNLAADARPRFSPDGKTLIYFSQSRPQYESDKWNVVARSWPSGADKVLTLAWDFSADEAAFSADGKTLWMTADRLGQHSLFSMPSKGGPVQAVVKEGNLLGFRSSARGELFYAWDSLAGPADLYRLEEASVNRVARLTALNREALAPLSLGSFEQFRFAGHNGEPVYGMLVKPVGFDPQKKYPVAFLIHGGPQGSFGNHWHTRWNPQVYAGHGYAAVMIDFHGSTGYGQAFTDSIRGDWGGKPLEDLQKGLAEALKKYSFLDKDRVCALGASYGGYMINWMAGNWSEPFKCLVNHDGNLDERMAYFDTEELWFPEWEHGGTPWDPNSSYEKHNPVDHVAQWKTPMLVIHGGKDYRVVDTQGMATFTALQRRGIPSQFLYFPDENHWVLKPANSVLWHHTVLNWLDQWTSKPTSTQASPGLVR